MASITCGLTAEDRDQLRTPMLVLSIGLYLSFIMLIPLMFLPMCAIVWRWRKCLFSVSIVGDYIFCGEGDKQKEKIFTPLSWYPEKR